jgi:hypothetical protein
MNLSKANIENLEAIEDSLYIAVLEDKVTPDLTDVFYALNFTSF